MKDAVAQTEIHCEPIRCAAYHDFFITEHIDGDIQVEITLEALDADELVDKMKTLKTLVSSVRILVKKSNPYERGLA